MVFEQVLSLGGLCQTTQQIKNRFGFHLGSPFDWLITPLTALQTILRSDGADLGRSVYFTGNSKTAYCSYYNVAYQHEFKRDEQTKRPIINDETLAQCRQKLLHKFNRMDQLLSQNRPTLFVRLVGHHDRLQLLPYARDARPVLPEDLNDLVDTIRKKYPALPFQVAFVYFDHCTYVLDKERLDPAIRLFGLEETTDGWTGDDKEWDKVFSAFEFNIRKTEKAAAEWLHA